jgi:hypothetical protein
MPVYYGNRLLIVAIKAFGREATERVKNQIFLPSRGLEPHCQREGRVWNVAEGLERLVHFWWDGCVAGQKAVSLCGIMAN